MSTTDRVRAVNTGAQNASDFLVDAKLAELITTSLDAKAIELITRTQAASLRNQHRGYILFKRMFDFINAAIQLVLFSPLLLISMLAIKAYDRGPVFFCQERITGGPAGPRQFRIIKFRTMVVDAESMGAKITEKSDPRITPFGKLLRKFKIDEIPQLINILRGEMSFVGPRPQTLGYVEKFRDHYEVIHSVIPAGLTDLASIRFRDEGALLNAAEDPERFYIERIMPDKICCHQEYVRRMNFALDMQILWYTLVQVFIKR